jgi:hypothetical protein
MVLGGDHGVHACTIGHTQAGAQIVRVGHAVEHQQQRGLHAFIFQVIEQLVERTCVLDLFHTSCHTLVTVRADELGNAQGIGLDQTHPGLLGALQKLAHARIAARSLEIDFDDGLRGGLQTHADGVKAEKNFGGRHGAVLSRRLRQTWDSQGHVWAGC